MKIKRTKSGRQEIVKTGIGAVDGKPATGSNMSTSSTSAAGFNNGQNFASDSDQPTLQPSKQGGGGGFKSGAAMGETGPGAFQYQTTGAGGGGAVAAARVLSGKTDMGGGSSSSNNSGGPVHNSSISNSNNNGGGSNSAVSGHISSGGSGNHSSQSRNMYTTSAKQSGDQQLVNSRPQSQLPSSVSSSMSAPAKPIDSSSHPVGLQPHQQQLQQPQQQQQQQQQQHHHYHHQHADSNGSGSSGDNGPAMLPASSHAASVSSAVPSSNHFQPAFSSPTYLASTNSSSSSNGPASYGGKAPTFSPLTTGGLQQLTTKKLKVKIGRSWLK
jgi:hypothetical protein